MTNYAESYMSTAFLDVIWAKLTGKQLTQSYFKGLISSDEIFGILERADDKRSPVTGVSGNMLMQRTISRQRLHCKINISPGVCGVSKWPTSQLHTELVIRL